MRRRDIVVACGSLAALIYGGVAAAHPAAPRTIVYIGTHSGGEGQGIFAARLDEASGTLTSMGSVAGIERPTWLVRDPHRPILYWVSETGNDGKVHGSVYSLSIDRHDGTLGILSRSDSGGSGATYLDYSPQLSTVFVANFGDGSVSAIPVGPDGKLKAAVSVQADTGSGPTPRQKGPHAHSVIADPTGRFLLVPDFGADRIFVYRIDGKTQALTPGDPPFLQMPAGAGPRHLVFSRDGSIAFLNTELTGEIYTLRWNAKAGRLTQVSRVALDPPDFTGKRSSAEIGLSGDGRFLYALNRGENAVQVYRVDGGTGRLTEIQKVPCGGDVPWGFGIDPDGRWLIVANEKSGNLATFAIDRASGKLTVTNHRLSVPAPVAIAFSNR